MSEGWIRFAALSASLCAMSACADERLSGYADRAAIYVLTEMDGAPVAGRITIGFPESGQIAGQGPCNSYSGSQTAPYPWFEAGPIRTTRRACPALTQEAAYLTALTQMELAEVLGGVLILSNSAGRQLVYRTEPDQP